MAYPPPKPKQWTDADLTGNIVQAVDTVFARLLSLEMHEDKDGQLQPVAIPLAPEAQAEFIRFYNAHAKEQSSLDADLAAAWSKLEGYAARFALLVHLVRDAADDSTLRNRSVIDLQSMETGITLSRWFADEAARIYAEIGGTPDDGESRKARERGRLVEWIRGKGGSVTVRDLTRGPRQYRGDSQTAECALQDLVDAGFGTWTTDDHGGGRGRPARVLTLTSDGDRNNDFHIVTGGDGDTNDRSPGKAGIVSPSPPSPVSESAIVSPGERVRVTI
jgi:hypothetical protein